MPLIANEPASVVALKFADPVTFSAASTLTSSVNYVSPFTVNARAPVLLSMVWPIAVIAFTALTEIPVAFAFVDAWLTLIAGTAAVGELCFTSNADFVASDVLISLLPTMVAPPALTPNEFCTVKLCVTIAFP